MNKTKIEWVKNSDGTQGYTWNPITGCLGPNGSPRDPKRCPYCYAHKLAKGRLKNLYLSNLGEISVNPHQDFENVIPHGDSVDPFTPRYWPDRAIEPYKLRKPGTIFICSMGELFGKFIPEDWINNILDTCRELPEHTFQVLTKCPENAVKYEFPDNVWFGVTVTGKESKNQQWKLLKSLAEINVNIRFFSFEPLLAELVDYRWEEIADWIIIGAQTNPDQLPRREWIERVIAYYKLVEIPVFLKSNLKPLLGKNLRQELPSINLTKLINSEVQK